MSTQNKKSFLIYISIVAAILVIFNIVSRNWFFRLDLTDNKMYSLSNSSKTVLGKLDDLMTLKVYFSTNLPGEYGNNRRYLQDILEEYAAYSDGNLKFEFFEPKNNEELETEAQKSGVRPMQIQTVEKDEVVIKVVYMGMVFLYEDERETIPFITTKTGLEYEITTKIKKLVDSNKSSIAIATTANQVVANEKITQNLEINFNVRKINLDSEIPLDIAVVLLNGVSDSLSADEYHNIEDYIKRGGNLLIAQNRINADIQTQQATPIVSNIFDLLTNYGLNIKENLVLDKNCSRVTMQIPTSFLGMQVMQSVQKEYPFLPVIEHFNKDEIIVNGLEQLLTFFPSEIILDSLHSTTPLFRTSNRSASMKEFYNLSPNETNNSFSQLNEKGKIISAHSKVLNDETGLIGQIILISDSKFFADDGFATNPENYIFILNTVDYLLGDEELIDLRSREITSRPLEKLEEEERSRWKWINILLPSILVVVFGFIRLKRENSRAKVLEEIYG